MKFKVGDRFRISTDRYNWMFQEYKGVDKNNKEQWDTWGYWGTIEQLAHCIPDHMVRRLEGDDLSQGSEWMKQVLDLQEAVREARDATAGILSLGSK